MVLTQHFRDQLIADFADLFGRLSWLCPRPPGTGATSFAASHEEVPGFLGCAEKNSFGVGEASVCGPRGGDAALAASRRARVKITPAKRSSHHNATAFLAHHPQPLDQSVDLLKPETMAATGPYNSPLVDPYQKKEPEKCTPKCMPGPGEICKRCNADGTTETNEQKMKRIAKEASDRLEMGEIMDIEAFKELSLNGVLPECNGAKLRTITHCRIPPSVGENATADIDQG
eukprot:g18126.t1